MNDPKPKKIDRETERWQRWLANQDKYDPLFHEAIRQRDLIADDTSREYALAQRRVNKLMKQLGKYDGDKWKTLSPVLGLTLGITATCFGPPLIGWLLAWLKGGDRRDVESAQSLSYFWFALTVFVSIVVGIGFLIESGVRERDGRIFKILEILEALSITYLALIGAYSLIEGLRTLYFQNMTLFLILVCCAVFVGYYRYQKKNGTTKSGRIWSK